MISFNDKRLLFALEHRYKSFYILFQNGIKEKVIKILTLFKELIIGLMLLLHSVHSNNIIFKCDFLILFYTRTIFH